MWEGLNPMQVDQFQSLKSGESQLAVVGLGYVGLPLLIAFAKKGFSVLGFDIHEKKIGRLRDRIDDTGELNEEDLTHFDKIQFSSDPHDLKSCSFIIVAVPTPIDGYNTPDLTPLEKASETIGQNLSKGATVVFESTVYPGVTEEFCVPVIEKSSGLSWQAGDFHVGYSPERINPGDKKHRLENITKVVSGESEDVCQLIAKVYSSVVEVGVFEAKSIKVAEAAKVIENTQRDLNISLMNELSVIFHKIGIDTKDVLEAAGTKWNFLKFFPGLVGGHCIGVDPYYLTSLAEQSGYHPQVVLAGRRINDQMSRFVAAETVKSMIDAGQKVRGAKALVMGLTFKENVPDFRNSKVFDLINELGTYGLDVVVHDPFMEHCRDQGKVNVQKDLKLSENFDVIIIANRHDEYLDMSLSKLHGFTSDGNTHQPVLVDLKWIYDRESAERQGFYYWTL
jgi:UDP-N-acetyl-D-galactosamine dehydrogenase